MHHYIKNKPIKWAFKFWFLCGSKSVYATWGRRLKLKLVLVCPFSLPFRESKNSHCYLFFGNFFTSAKLTLKLLQNGIYGTETAKVNRKCMPFLKEDKQTKCGKHAWWACASFSATRWMGSKSVIFLSNCHDPRAVHVPKKGKRIKRQTEVVLSNCCSWI